jgi:membrane-associated protease RseP (regulator of RpoE activity)
VEQLGWLIFLVALLFSVMLHETGHFVVAKRFGMKAPKFMVGFGPTLFSFTRGGTEYGLKLIPVGGYTKIVGMTALEDVDPEDEPHSFRQAPRWQRLIVLVAGSVMHFVLAAVLIFGVAAGIGIENDNTTQLGTVATCVPASETALNNGAACTASDNAKSPSPAALAGLKVGDQVTSFNGVKVTSWTQLSSVIKDVKPGSPVTIGVDRGGQHLTLHTTLTSVSGRAGGYLGIAPATVIQPASPLAAIDYVGTGFAQTITGTGSIFGHFHSVVSGLFSSHRSQTAAGSVVGVVGAANDTGQAVAANVGWQYKVSFILLLMASLNIAFGIANQLPLLPLDGGHEWAVIWEGTRAWFARRRGRPDPGLVDYRKLAPVSLSLFAVLAVLVLIVAYADIVNPVNIG